MSVAPRSRVGNIAIPLLKIFPTRDRGATLTIRETRYCQIFEPRGFCCCDSSCAREIISPAFETIRLPPQHSSPPAVPTVSLTHKTGQKIKTSAPPASKTVRGRENIFSPIRRVLLLLFDLVLGNTFIPHTEHLYSRLVIRLQWLHSSGLFRISNLALKSLVAR